VASLLNHSAALSTVYWLKSKASDTAPRAILNSFKKPTTMNKVIYRDEQKGTRRLNHHQRWREAATLMTEVWRCRVSFNKNGRKKEKEARLFPIQCTSESLVDGEDDCKKIQ